MNAKEVARKLANKTREDKVKIFFTVLAEGGTLVYKDDSGHDVEVEAFHFLWMADKCRIKRKKV